MKDIPDSLIRLAGALGPQELATLLGWRLNYSHGPISFNITQKDLPPTFAQLKSLVEKAGFQLDPVEDARLFRSKRTDLSFLLWVWSK